jgi:hypothetical protein
MFNWKRFSLLANVLSMVISIMLLIAHTNEIRVTAVEFVIPTALWLFGMFSNYKDLSDAS